MTFEQAMFFKVMLLNGHPEELLRYIDSALEAQDPISNIVLELSFATSDDRSLLHLLNEYIETASLADIDFDGVLMDMFLSFFRKKYREENMSVDELTYLMYKCALVYAPWDKMWDTATSKLWRVMYYMHEYYEFCDKNEFFAMIDAFLDEKTPIRIFGL